MSRKKIPYSSELILELAGEMGAKVWLEPEFGYVGMIIFSSGKRQLFRKGKYNINPVASATIAKDKDYTSMFLRRFGYSVVDGDTFFREDACTQYQIEKGKVEGWNYIEKIGLPVILKPNDLAEGQGVTKVTSKEDYDLAVKEIFQISEAMRIEQYFVGNDYRVVVLDDEVISAYRRIPLTLIGDGIHDIGELFSLKKSSFSNQGRPIGIDISDSRIEKNIEQSGYTYESILDKSEHLQLLDNANLTTGGESEDMSEFIHPDFMKIALGATHDIGLRLAGVDIMCRDIREPIGVDNPYVIIEINSSPGLDNYLSLGEEQRIRVKGMYRKLLLALSQL